MITVTVEATVPDEKMLYWFLDWVLTFDRTHPDCQFGIVADAATTTAEMREIFERLGLDIVASVERK